MNSIYQDRIVDLSADRQKVNPTIVVHQGEVTLLLGGNNKVSYPLFSGYLLYTYLETEALNNRNMASPFIFRTSGVMGQSSPTALFNLRDLIAVFISSNVG